MKRILRDLVDALIVGFILTEAARTWWDRHRARYDGWYDYG